MALQSSNSRSTKTDEEGDWFSQFHVNNNQHQKQPISTSASSQPKTFLENPTHSRNQPTTTKHETATLNPYGDDYFARQSQTEPWKAPAAASSAPSKDAKPRVPPNATYSQKILAMMPESLPAFVPSFASTSTAATATSGATSTSSTLLSNPRQPTSNANYPVKVSSAYPSQQSLLNSTKAVVSSITSSIAATTSSFSKPSATSSSSSFYSPASSSATQGYFNNSPMNDDYSPPPPAGSKKVASAYPQQHSLFNTALSGVSKLVSAASKSASAPFSKDASRRDSNATLYDQGASQRQPLKWEEEEYESNDPNGFGKRVVSGSQRTY